MACRRHSVLATWSRRNARYIAQLDGTVDFTSLICLRNLAHLPGQCVGVCLRLLPNVAGTTRARRGGGFSLLLVGPLNRSKDGTAAKQNHGDQDRRNPKEFVDGVVQMA